MIIVEQIDAIITAYPIGSKVFACLFIYWVVAR